MEAAELGSDNHEHSVQRLRILDGRQESGIHAEAQCNLGRGVKVGLENVLVKDDKLLHNLLLVLVGNIAGNLLQQLFLVEDSIHLQTLVTQGWDEVVILATGLNVVCIGKGEVERADQVRVLVDNVVDVVPSKGLLAQAALKLGENLDVQRIVLVKH